MLTDGLDSPPLALDCVLATPLTRQYRGTPLDAWRWRRRNPVVACLFSSVAALLSLLVNSAHSLRAQGIKYELNVPELRLFEKASEPFEKTGILEQETTGVFEHSGHAPYSLAFASPLDGQPPYHLAFASPQEEQQKERFAKSLTDIDKALRSNPPNLDRVYTAKGIALEHLAELESKADKRKEMYDSAVQAYTQALVHSDKTRARPKLDRGRCQYKRAFNVGQREFLKAAREDLQDALLLKATPMEEVEVYFWLGQSSWRQALPDFAEAQRHFEKAASLAKQNPTLRYASAWKRLALKSAAYAAFRQYNLKKEEQTLSHWRKAKKLADQLVVDAAAEMDKGSLFSAAQLLVEMGRVYETRTFNQPVEAMHFYRQDLPENLENTTVAQLPLLNAYLLVQVQDGFQTQLEKAETLSFQDLIKYAEQAIVLTKPPYFAPRDVAKAYALAGCCYRHAAKDEKTVNRTLCLDRVQQALKLDPQYRYRSDWYTMIFEQAFALAQKDENKAAYQQMFMENYNLALANAASEDDKKEIAALRKNLEEQKKIE